MIIGILHKGSGLGDQLFSYVATRVRAYELGLPFSFVGKEYFKGKDFMVLDWGEPNEYTHHVEEPSGKVIIHEKHKLFVVDKPYYDPEFNFIEDGTVIDGFGAQDERYWKHRLDVIKQWVQTPPYIKAPIGIPPNICVVNVRGGEYRAVPELLLPESYWQSAMDYKRRLMPNMVFQVHTDDPEYVKSLSVFKDCPVISGIKLNWTAIREARHLIISNSAFAILPAHLNPHKPHVVAPRYWAGRNVGEWRRPQNFYFKFTYR